MKWNVFDVAFIGTSLTFGRQYWQENLQRRLQLQTERPLQFYDFGFSGATASMLLDNVTRSIGMRPRAFVLECAMNDANTGVGVSPFTTTVTSMVQSLKADASAKVFLMTMNPAISPASAGLVSSLPGYYQALRNIAAVQSVGLIDNTASFGSPTTAQIPDGVHPTTAVMQAAIIPNLLTALQPLATA